MIDGNKVDIPRSATNGLYVVYVGDKHFWPVRQDLDNTGFWAVKMPADFEVTPPNALVQEMGRGDYVVAHCQDLTLRWAFRDGEFKANFENPRRLDPKNFSPGREGA